jgi:UDP-N-acetylmuramate--alanine ligase
MNRDSKKFDEVTSGIACKLVTYSLKEDADYTAANIEHDAFGCGSFDCYENGNLLGRITLSVPGIHNVSNALATVAAVRTLGIPADAIIEGLKNFTGADRRFEYKGKMGEVTVIDDYAHHPTEIKATLTATVNYPHRETWVIFQPHTYTRTKALLPEFAEALTGADHIILAKIYEAREKDIYGISSQDLADEIAKYGKDVRYIPTFSEIEEYVRTHCKPGDILITMGVGNVTYIGPALID